MIRTENLCKSYGQMKALKNLNLTIESGTVFGFIGPNGAGKSTTMQILSTLLQPTSGKAWVGGYDVMKEQKDVRRIIGYMPDFFGVYDNLTALEYLDFYAGCYGVEKEARKKISLELLELVNLADKRDSYVDELSRGMKQRLGLARSLVHDPQLLILDEPASGLDPRARIEFREILKELRSMGKTIMISSHILPELSGLCDTIGVMEHGELIAFGSVDEIADQARQQGREIEIKVLKEIDQATEVLESLGKVLSVNEETGQISFQVKGKEEQLAEILQQLIQHQVPVIGFHEVQVDMEDVFLQVTKGYQEVSPDEQATTELAE
ncbi:ABC transporter ATP-binding protein [Hazenella coriacea]|uniref:ABC-2 type transport system ATP-binding protein n=1 Tax=Hazenella coriacea TaxID=1179467 RepID=A0A4R3LCH5_9BACL|nr:ABC transporter ATP-binding protein [Hazenella coriacea]TCS96975.1 ABC-2 type transport system ATP-binding protein [Hazenella coriacea]